MKTPLTKHTFHLEAGQLERLNRLHPNIPAAVIIRRLIGSYLEKTEPVLTVSHVTLEKVTVKL